MTPAIAAAVPEDHLPLAALPLKCAACGAILGDYIRVLGQPLHCTRQNVDTTAVSQ